MVPDNKIVRFIGRHHVMSMASCSNNVPYCCNLFYAYNKESNRFVFTTDSSTRHGREIDENAVVAASIVLETNKVGKIEGLQLTGRVRKAEQGEQGEQWARRCYLTAFPFAVVADLHLWIFEPEFMKLTDNRLGFGKKIVWNSDD